MLYQVNNKAQAVRIANYSVNNFPSVFETLYDENVKFNANTVGDAGAAVPIVDDNGVQLPYL